MLCQLACSKCRREYFDTVVFEKYKENGNTLFQNPNYKQKFLSQRDEWFVKDWNDGFVFCHKMDEREDDELRDETKNREIPVATGMPPKNCLYKLEHIVSS